MTVDLREIETGALSAQKSGAFASAITLWEELLKIRPDWESGYAYYYLADCYTRIGKLDLAESAYREAIRIAPEDELFSSTLRSLIAARQSGLIK